uniref:Uncharacterized protein n=1 Tax=Cyprinodon variegatus TaxID=28743 RepID=A0A3Q2DPA9_CYPVA
MAGQAFAKWWSAVGPYYTKVYQEMWVGVGIMTYLYYKFLENLDCFSPMRSLNSLWCRVTSACLFLFLTVQSKLINKLIA